MKRKMDAIEKGGKDGWESIGDDGWRSGREVGEAKRMEGCHVTGGGQMTKHGPGSGFRHQDTQKVCSPPGPQG